MIVASYGRAAAMILLLTILVAIFALGFGSGYGLRALISHKRRIQSLLR